MTESDDAKGDPAQKYIPSLEQMQQVVPMKRLAKPEEIGGACVYLSSELAGFMTGSTMNICGGLYYQ